MRNSHHVKRHGRRKTTPRVRRLVRMHRPKILAAKKSAKPKPPTPRESCDSGHTEERSAWSCASRWRPKKSSANSAPIWQGHGGGGGCWEVGLDSSFM